MKTGTKAIAIARRRPGRTAAELADLLSCEGGERNVVSSALYRAVRAGLLVARGERTRRYYPTERAWSPETAAESRRLRGREPAAGAEPFTWRGKTRVPVKRGWKFTDETEAA